MLFGACPVCRAIARSLAPRAAAVVQNPARREWPEYLSGSSPARSAADFTIRATACPVRARSETWPHLSTARNTGPSVIPAMASHAETAVVRSMRALTEHNDALARQVEEEDNILDQFEIEIDDTALHLLTKAPLATDLRLITVGMKISQNLERVGDEAVTIARRARDLSTEPQLKPYVDIPRMATMGLPMPLNVVSQCGNVGRVVVVLVDKAKLRDPTCFERPVRHRIKNAGGRGGGILRVQRQHQHPRDAGRAQAVQA